MITNNLPDINSKTFRDDAEAYARGQVTALTALAKMNFGTGLPADFGPKTFKFKLDWSADRNRSNANFRQMSIAMRRHCVNEKWFHEYRHYAASEFIGDIFCPTWQDKLLAVLGHEMAHVVQTAFRTGTLAQYTSEPHGWAFQKIYRVIRVQYVNRVIKEHSYASQTNRI